MRTKLIPITCCDQCPNIKYDFPGVRLSMARILCKLTGKEITELGEIPEWCPLMDGKEME